MPIDDRTKPRKGRPKLRKTHRTEESGAAECMYELMGGRPIPAPEERVARRKLVSETERLKQIPREDLPAHPLVVTHAREAFNEAAETADVSSPPNGAVLWSGGTEGAGAMAQEHVDEQNAAGHPSARLETTAGGKLLTTAAQGTDYNLTKDALTTASQRFARSITGSVEVFIKAWPREDSDLHAELSELTHNGNVTEINIHIVKTEPYVKEDGRTSDRLVRDANGKGIIEADITVDDFFDHYRS